jgi:DNA-binding transcriptional regulator LsrR (DeoR family)
MTEKERRDKKDLARLYYMRGEPQKVIASAVGVSEVSISKWVKAENWDMKRAAERVTRPELVNQNLQLIAKLQAQIIDSDNPVAEAKSLSDQISKLAAAIEKLDKKTNIIQIQDGFIAFSKWLQEHPQLRSQEGVELIRTIDKYQDEYLNYRFNNHDK